MLHAVLHLPHIAVNILAGASFVVTGFALAEASAGDGDNTAVTLALIAAVPVTLGIFATLIATIYVARRTSKVAVTASQTLDQAKETHHLVNSALAKLIEGVQAKAVIEERERQAAIDEARAEGVTEGQRRGQDEHPELPAPPKAG